MEPNPLAIVLLCVGAAAVLIFLLWLNHRLRVPPKREEAPKKTRAGALEIMLSYIMGGAGPVNDYEDEGTYQDEPEPIRSPQVNHAEPQRTNGSGSAELALNAEELEAVARMIKHNASAAKPSKSSTIQAGFGVARGGSAAYVRASLIYDALFGRPEPAIETPLAGRRTSARFPSDKTTQSVK